jgi:hypothetical protein
MITKALLDYFDPDNDGYKIYSQRLYDQLRIFVHLGNNKVGSVKGAGNHDDLSMAAGFALVGGADALISDSSHLVPSKYNPTEINDELKQDELNSAVAKGGINCLMPVVLGPGDVGNQKTPMEEFQNFMRSMGGVQPGTKQIPSVVQRKNQLKLPNK